MLRHFKMEMLKRQQEELQSLQSLQVAAVMPTEQQQQQQHQLAPMTNVCSSNENLIKAAGIKTMPKTNCETKAARSRSRRASKPQMEKRRRARINECLDILKSYVLTDSSNLTYLGIDPAASENQDEETIARAILKSSGLIHRHRGRKNPNKLEKADILELTVDYVRRLHEQRNDLLNKQIAPGNSISGPQLEQQQQHQHNNVINLKMAHNQNNATTSIGQQQQLLSVPAHLSEPLTLDLSPKFRVLQQQQSLMNGADCHNDLLISQHQISYNCPITPPPSSASSIRSGVSDDGLPSRNHVTQQMLLSRVLDSYKLYDMLPYQQQRC